MKGHLVNLQRVNDSLSTQLEQMQQVRADAEALSGITINGIEDALVASVTGGDVRAAFSDLFAGLGRQFLDMAFRPIAEVLSQEIAKLLGFALVDATQTAAVSASTAATVALTPAVVSQTTATLANTTAVTALTAALATQPATSAATSGLGGILGGIGSLFSGASGALGSAASGLAFNPIAFTPGLSFFSGGGYTGDGPRSGGLDGEGGYLAVLHPRETVIDHQRSDANPFADARSALGRYSPTNALAQSRDALENKAPAGPTFQPISLNVTATRIADDRWVKVDDLEVALAETRRQAAADGARMGETRVMSSLKNSPGARRRIGI